VKGRASCARPFEKWPFFGESLPYLRWNGTPRNRPIFLYNPIQLFAVNKAVAFVPYVTTLINLAETAVTEQHWSVRQAARTE
jgi:hypothetical protein